MQIDRTPLLNARGLRVMLIVLGILIAIFGQLLIYSPFETTLPTNILGVFRSARCAIPFICQNRFPELFLPGLLVMLAGAVLFSIAGIRNLQLSTAGNGLADAEGRAASQSKVFIWLIVLGLVSSVVSMGVAFWLYFPAGTTPHVGLWLITVGGLLLASFAWDLRNRRRHFSIKDLILLAAYLVLLVVLGWVHASSSTLSVLVDVALIVALALLAFTRRLEKFHAGFVAIVIALFFVYSQNLDSWKYSFIGDEYASWLLASAIYKNYIAFPILKLSGVYGAHPVFASYNQALTMTLFGANQYGWRMSEVMAVMLTAPALYIFARRMISPAAGLAAVFIFLASHHMWAISRAGYTHSQGLVPCFVGLALAEAAVRKRSLLLATLAGITSAFGLYTFALTVPFAIFPGLLLLLLLIRRYRMAAPEVTSRNRMFEALCLLAVFVIAGLFAAFPGLFDKQWFNTAISHSIDGNEVKTDNPLMQQMLPNFLYSATSFMAFLTNAHYTSGAHFDPLSSALTLCGMIACLFMARRSVFAIWLLLSFVLLNILVGAFVPYSYPSNTRTFLVLPWFALFAAVGIQAILDLIRGLAGMRLIAPALGIAGALLISGMNAYIFFVRSEKLLVHTPITQVIRSLQETGLQVPHKLVSAPPYDNPNIRMVIDAYGYTKMFGFVRQENALEELKKLAENGSFVVLLPNSLPQAPAWIVAQAQLADTTRIVDMPLGFGGMPYTRIASVDVASELATTMLQTRTKADSILVNVPVAVQQQEGRDKVAQTVAGSWQVTLPRGIAIKRNGEMYVVNGGTAEVVVLNRQGEFVRKVSHLFTEPFGVLVTVDDNLVVLDSKAPPHLFMFDAKDKLIAQASGDASLSNPRGISADAMGNIYVADTSNGRIVRFSQDMTKFQSIVNTEVLKQPSSIFVDGDYLLVADAARILKLSRTGQPVVERRFTSFVSIASPQFLRVGEKILATDPEKNRVLVLSDELETMSELVGPALAKPSFMAVDGKVLHVLSLDSGKVDQINLSPQLIR